ARAVRRPQASRAAPGAGWHLVRAADGRPVALAAGDERLPVGLHLLATAAPLASTPHLQTAAGEPAGRVASAPSDRLEPRNRGQRLGACPPRRTQNRPKSHGS